LSPHWRSSAALSASIAPTHKGRHENHADNQILAIGTINPGFGQSQVRAVLPEEGRETIDLESKVEQ
jgi:hypothetical protein